MDGNPTNDERSDPRPETEADRARAQLASRCSDVEVTTADRAEREVRDGR